VKLGKKGDPYRDQDAAIRMQGMMIWWWVPEAFRKMAPYLDKRFLEMAYEFAKRIQYAPTRAEILAGIGPYLEPSLLPEILSQVEEIHDTNQERSKALIELAPHLNESLLRKALEIASRIRDERSRSNALAGLLPHLAKLGYSLEAMTTAREIPESFSRIKALVGLVPHLNESWQLGVLEEATELLLSSEKDRTQLLELLAPLLESLPSTTLFQKLTIMLHSLSAGTRREVFVGLKALAPLITQLGGTKAVEETARAIQDVWRWWS
jgi:hypothetical protein